MIEDVDFDIDGGYGANGRGVRAYLILYGDFVEEFERYLADPDRNYVALQIGRDLGIKLVNRIGDHL